MHPSSMGLISRVVPFFFAAVTAGASWGGATTAQAQQNIPEIPLTFRPPFDARYAGMGGVSIAVADDHNASISNPAALGLVRQIEFGIGFTHQKASRDVTYLGTTTRAEFGKTRLSNLGFAYPFPTYRGSFVVGGAYARLSPLDSDFYKVGRGPTTTLEREGIYQEGSLGAYSGSVAFQPTRAIYVGATGTILHGGNYYDRTFEYEGILGSANFQQVQDYDITGFSGSVGALADLGVGLRMGLVLHFPEGLDLDGSETDRFPVSDSVDVFDFSDHIYLPYRLGMGLAFARPNLILAIDAIYTDWTQISFLGPLRLDNRQFAYRQTVDVHIGGEFLFSAAIPIRVRAGYALEPIPYRVVLVDVPNGIYESAAFQRDRHYFTFGAGILLAETMTIDLAYMDGGFTRSGSTTSTTSFQEKERDRRLLASLSVRLPFGRN